jgi:hypothetical protein
MTMANARENVEIIRFASKGIRPESSGAASIRTMVSPISAPEATAITRPRGLGRRAPFSGTNPTKIIATRATPRAMKNVVPPLSPSPRPILTGTMAEMNAVVGDRILIGPIAKLP